MRKKTVTMMLGFCVLLIGMYLLFQSGARMMENWKSDICEQVAETAEKTFLPRLFYTLEAENGNKKSFLMKQIEALLPFLRYVSAKETQGTEIEDSLTYQMILEQQGKDEERMSEDLLENPTEEVAASGTASAADFSIDKLRDFNTLLSKFYTVDSTTTIGPDQLNVDALLAKDMHIDTSTDGPKVLIFHTHSQEAFADSVAGDAGTTIVGIGAYLAEKLNEKGISTMHHAGVYDLIDGKLDRSRAYEFAETGVKEILNQNPSIEVVIDLHRDGVRDDLHLVNEIDGKQVAKIMFFTGLSRTKANGDIAYLYNPYIQDNLSFSFQMQLVSESRYPGFARRIYLKGYRYSLHMMPKSLLIEAGAQTNTVAEMKNAMDLLANVLRDVLVG